MENTLATLLSEIDVFLLVFVRMTGLFVIAPIFGRRNIPVYLKIGFSFMLAIIVMNTLSTPAIDYSNNIYIYASVIIKEFLVGIAIGYVSYMVFTAIYVAGQLIDMRIGFGMVNVIDPMSNIQIPITANFYFLISMLIFMTVGGHHILIKALYDSYNYVPIGQAVFGTDLVNDAIRVFGSVFVIGFKIGAPVTAAILVVDVALGVIAKAVPQLNVFVVGMPLKIALGLTVILISLYAFRSIVDVLIDSMSNEIMNFLEHMGT